MSKKLQKIFDRAVGGILKQGTSSIIMDCNDRAKCMYRGDNGAKCAIGHLIPDFKYDEKMENKSIEQLIQHNWFPYKYGQKYRIFLTELQLLHDNNSYMWDTVKVRNVKKIDKLFIFDFKIDAKEFAKNNNLEWNF